LGGLGRIAILLGLLSGLLVGLGLAAGPVGRFRGYGHSSTDHELAPRMVLLNRLGLGGRLDEDSERPFSPRRRGRRPAREVIYGYVP